MTKAENINEMDTIDMWEQQLDQLGIDAPVKALAKHLSCAPEGAPSRDFLSGFISASCRM